MKVSLIQADTCSIAKNRQLSSEIMCKVAKLNAYALARKILWSGEPSWFCADEKHANTIGLILISAKLSRERQLHSG